MANIQRLLRLADHLEKGKLGHEKFYFGFYNSGNPAPGASRPDDPRLMRCGTTGCGIGECPFVFPEWYFNEQCQPVLTGHIHPEPSALSWFELHICEYEHLFIHERQRTLRYGGIPLKKEASKEDLAANIRIFCTCH